MSRDPRRPYGMQPRDRDRERDRDRDRERVVWGRSDFRKRSPVRKRSRSRSPPMRSVGDSNRGRSPRRNDKDLLDENILSEISKLPEPSELWDSQHQDPNFNGPPPPSFPPPEPPNPSYPNYQQSYSGIYDDFPSVPAVPAAPAIPPEIASWNQMSLPPPPGPPAQVFVNNIEDQIKKEAAIESEMRHQKAALSKQREDYIKKAGILKKELDTLKDQRNELRGDAKRSPSPDTKRFLKENTKLQLEIQNKLKTINNVVDMLNGIIGEEAQELPDSDDSERTSKRKSRSPSGKKSNYVYYDPEMHWCRVCNEFPPTAKDYLNHLHSPAHHKMAAAHMEAPWHSVSGMNEGFPSYPAAPTKRTPIRGLQFFVPSTAWYCKLCDQFIGDLHCASAHLKSIQHSKNYTNFVEQNPHWETDWMSDRQKAFEKAQAGKGKPADAKPAGDKPQYTAHTITFHKDGFHTKRTAGAHDKKPRRDKKKKAKRKRSSSDSDSSDSSSSDSDADLKKKKKRNKKDKEKSEPDEKTLTDWMSSIQADRLNDSDRKLLDTIKSRLKYDKEEKRRSSDRSAERSTREREHSEDSRKTRERERERERERDRDRERERASRRRSPAPEPKKPEIKKMPFIGKMPVYKHMQIKPKTEEQKKEEQKKKEEDEASKKRREEMDAEIQKKVAEFKQKIARAQLDRQAQVELPPPGVALPRALAAPPHPAPAAHPLPPHPAHPALPAQPAQPVAYQPQPTPPPAATPQPTLPKDFQEALDIIFPSDVKPELGQDGILGFPPGLGGFGMLGGMGGMGGFPLPGLLGPGPLGPGGLGAAPQMFPFELFPPRPQLYDTHVPLVPSPKPRHQRPKNDKKKSMVNKPPPPRPAEPAKPAPSPQPPAPAPAPAPARRDDLDDLAMLGIDASDVGANI